MFNKCQITTYQILNKNINANLIPISNLNQVRLGLVTNRLFSNRISFRKCSNLHIKYQALIYFNQISQWQTQIQIVFKKKVELIIFILNKMSYLYSKIPIKNKIKVIHKINF